MYISQAFNVLHDWWRYAIPLLAFLGLSLLNYAAVELLSLDINQIIKDEIERKGSTRFLAENLIPFAIFLGLLILWVKFVHKQTFRSLTTSRKKINWGRIAFGFFIVAIPTILLTYFDYKSNPDDYVYQFRLQPFLILALVVIILMPFQTSFEEYLFRGYLMQGIGVIARNRWLPLIVTSVVFGGLHFFNPEVDKLGPIIMVYYIGTGFFLGIMTLMDEGMELALGFHAGNNMIAAMLVTADWTVFQTNSILKDISEPSAGVDILIPVLVMYPVFLGIMAWKYKWTGWGEKLFGRVTPPANSIEQ